jgi:hypothetical protein
MTDLMEPKYNIQYGHTTFDFKTKKCKLEELTAEVIFSVHQKFSEDSNKW